MNKQGSYANYGLDVMIMHEKATLLQGFERHVNFKGIYSPISTMFDTMTK